MQRLTGKWMLASVGMVVASLGMTAGLDAGRCSSTAVEASSRGRGLGWSRGPGTSCGAIGRGDGFLAGIRMRAGARDIHSDALSS